MEASTYETLEDITPHVREHLLPEIQQAVEVCVKAYLEDEFNDTWTFGTQFWKNTWNRFEAVAEFKDCPFGVYGKGNEYNTRPKQSYSSPARVNHIHVSQITSCSIRRVRPRW